MNDEQRNKAMILLAELYAEQNGIKKPQITIKRNGEKV